MKWPVRKKPLYKHIRNVLIIQYFSVMLKCKAAAFVEEGQENELAMMQDKVIWNDTIMKHR